MTSPGRATSEQMRREHLKVWARKLEAAATRGLFGKPFALLKTSIIPGPRAGALEIHAGFASGDLMRSLQADDCALLRQLVTWDFTGEPAVFMAGRAVRVEAGWPPDLADSAISLKSLGQYPKSGGRWLVGKNERGNVLTAGVSDATPHWLISGTTGSGKTTALVSATAQLARDPGNRLILIDTKHDRGFKPFGSVRGLAGPICGDIYAARAALAWSVQEMANRYSGGQDTRRLVIVIDEVQNIAGDSVASAFMQKLVAEGRGARVHVLVATQHPVMASLGGPTVGRNLVGRLALKVMDAKASEVAVGAPHPRADHLLGAGDSYAVTPNATHRTQVAYFDDAFPLGQPDLAEWPDDAPEVQDAASWPDGDEVGAAILSATRGEGRIKFQRACVDYGINVADNNRAVKLLHLARDVLDFMNDHEMAVCLSENEGTHPQNARFDAE